MSFASSLAVSGLKTLFRTFRKGLEYHDRPNPYCISKNIHSRFFIFFSLLTLFPAPSPPPLFPSCSLLSIFYYASSSLSLRFLSFPLFLSSFLSFLSFSPYPLLPPHSPVSLLPPSPLPFSSPPPPLSPPTHLPPTATPLLNPLPHPTSPSPLTYPTFLPPSHPASLPPLLHPNPTPPPPHPYPPHLHLSLPPTPFLPPTHLLTLIPPSFPFPPNLPHTPTLLPLPPTPHPHPPHPPSTSPHPSHLHLPHPPPPLCFSSRGMAEPREDDPQSLSTGLCVGLIDTPAPPPRSAWISIRVDSVALGEVDVEVDGVWMWMGCGGMWEDVVDWMWRDVDWVEWIWMAWWMGVDGVDLVEVDWMWMGWIWSKWMWMGWICSRWMDVDGVWMAC
ncbi:hypothetical protein C7M84_024215 [Penaeus vannamei]|uniref:Uncharacterized protein n=1 Tax=Penaeus vannamei TaxID=6689 RepID=A0A3R7QY01_PENVA|nr:hypothetical protein C7M84_024215 [Penaeus vannamei]